MDTARAVMICMLCIIGCSTTAPVTQHVIVRDTTVVVQPYTIRDTVPVVVHDTVVIGQRIRGTDTIVRVVYAPRQQRMTVQVRTDTVRIRLRDTVRAQSDPIVSVQMPWWVPLALGTAGVIIIILLVRR